MQKESRRSLIFSVAAALAVFVFSLPFLFSESFNGRTTQIILADIICLLLILQGFLLFSLRRSLKITLYSYQNIGLIAGSLFSGVFTLVILSYFVTSLLDPHVTLSEVAQNIIAFPRHFSYYAVFVLIAICLLLGISNIVLIKKEGFCLNNALSLLVAVLYIGGTFLIYFISDILMEKIYIPFGISESRIFLTLRTVFPLFLLLMLCYFECVLVGSAVMGWMAARQKPDYDKDYIIILGCSIDKRGGLLPLLKGRVNRAIRFAWEQEIATGKPLHYVPSGGQGANEVISEGSAMELYLKTRGAEDDEVFPEKKSVNTRENFEFSKRIIDGLKPGASIAFATTNYHMLRSGILARRAGIDAQGIAGDTKWYFWPNGFVREFFGILSLEVKVHLRVAAAVAVLCAGIGYLCWSGIL